MFCFINKQRKGNKENFKYTDSSLTKRLKRRENFSLLRINNNVKNINGYLDRVAIFLVNYSVNSNSAYWNFEHRENV